MDLREPVLSVETDVPGVLVRINREALVKLARDADAVVVQVCEIGTYLPEGTTVLKVHPLGDGGAVPADPGRWRRALYFDVERTMEQDLGFGFRQLVDIAERALSPGINDPTTAVQAVDELHDLLRRMVAGPPPGRLWCDDDGVVRLETAAPTVAGLVDLAVDEVLHYGSNSLQIHGRMKRMLLDLLDVARPEHRTILAAKLQILGGTPPVVKDSE